MFVNDKIGWNAILIADKKMRASEIDPISSFLLFTGSVEISSSIPLCSTKARLSELHLYGKLVRVNRSDAA